MAVSSPGLLSVALYPQCGAGPAPASGGQTASISTDTSGQRADSRASGMMALMASGEPHTM